MRVGADIEQVERFKKNLGNSGFLESVFTPAEISYCEAKAEPHLSFAGKFCAKEAVIKSFGGGILPRDIEVLNTEAGSVYVNVRGRPEPMISVSISHAGEYAMAFAVRSDDG